MCGIAGILRLDNIPAPLSGDIRAMTGALAHRGPDDEGYFLLNRAADRPQFLSGRDTAPLLRNALPPLDACLDEPCHVALGHRRFSIIDISAAGHQPYADPLNRVILVFNGEIHNYIELREELMRERVTFHTQSDTEVLALAYLHWGEDVFAHLNGMWSLALYDRRDHRLLLSRDRSGERSLFYTLVDQCIYFASEIKALLQTDTVRRQRRVSDQRVIEYLYAGLRDHLGGSFFANIQQLPPASFAWVGEDCRNIEPVHYWRIPESRLHPSDLSYEEASCGLTTQLRSSIQLRLRSDVPLAIELSGGMDSSSIVALAAEGVCQAHGANRLRAYTVRYDDPAFDESAFAAETAALVGIEHHMLELQSDDYWSTAAQMMLVEEQPYESPNLLGSLAMWRQMRGKNIRVVLNGGGGDELLAGYITQHLAPFLAEMCTSRNWRVLMREAREWYGTPYLNLATLRRYGLRNVPFPVAGWYLRRMFGLSEFSHLRKPKASQGHELIRHTALIGQGGLSQCLLRNMLYSPMPMYMVQGDKTSMSTPIEVRFPFLDPHVIEYAFRLPVEYLIRGGFGKSLLRHAMRAHLPKSVLVRRQKMGFPVPLGQWMREGLGRIREMFEHETRSTRFIHTHGLSERLCSLSPESLWRLHQVELWMRTFDLT